LHVDFRFSSGFPGHFLYDILLILSFSFHHRLHIKFSKILAKFAKFWEKTEKIQQFLMKILSSESGAKECIV